MSSFTVLLLCIQACLVQNVFSHGCLGEYGPASASPVLAAPSLVYDGLAYRTAGWGAGLAAYGGAGEGHVAVAGELPVAGNTAVTGQVPIMGAVRFGGTVPAAGTVSISGRCACGCGTPYDYVY